MVTPYESADTVKNEGLSWAYDEADNSWKWSMPSPGSVKNNITMPVEEVAIVENTGLTPCNANQYRSSETNRCRLIASNVSSLVPCREGQYRSQETNRCRSAAGAFSSLGPCKAGQARNSLTNRCRSVLRASTSLKPCNENQARNPETNRCRNAVKGVSDTAFAVQPVKDGTKAFVGWWALGGLGILAGGYGVWEWRRELAGLAGRTKQFFTSAR